MQIFSQLTHLLVETMFSVFLACWVLAKDKWTFLGCDFMLRWETCYHLSGDVLKALLDTAGKTILNNDQEALKSFTNLVDQLPSVFGEVFLYPSSIQGC